MRNQCAVSPVIEAQSPFNTSAEMPTSIPSPKPRDKSCVEARAADHTRCHQQPKEPSFGTENDSSEISNCNQQIPGQANLSEEGGPSDAHPNWLHLGVHEDSIKQVDPLQSHENMLPMANVAGKSPAIARKQAGDTDEDRQLVQEASVPYENGSEGAQEADTPSQTAASSVPGVSSLVQEHASPKALPTFTAMPTEASKPADMPVPCPSDAKPGVTRSPDAASAGVPSSVLDSSQVKREPSLGASSGDGLGNVLDPRKAESPPQVESLLAENPEPLMAGLSVDDTSPTSPSSAPLVASTPVRPAMACSPVIDREPGSFDIAPQQLGDDLEGTAEAAVLVVHNQGESLPEQTSAVASNLGSSDASKPDVQAAAIDPGSSLEERAEQAADMVLPPVKLTIQKPDQNQAADSARGAGEGGAIASLESSEHIPDQGRLPSHSAVEEAGVNVSRSTFLEDADSSFCTSSYGGAGSQSQVSRSQVQGDDEAESSDEETYAVKPNVPSLPLQGFSTRLFNDYEQLYTPVRNMRARNVPVRDSSDPPQKAEPNPAQFDDMPNQDSPKSSG